MTAEVTLENRGDVAIVCLNRPTRKNAMNQAMWHGLDRALDQLADSAARAAIITGTGDSFCAGMDLQFDNPMIVTFQRAISEKDAGAARQLIHELRAIVAKVESLPMPTIAAINGLAYGGGAELTLACDMRVMDEQATLSFSETRLGLMPDLGGTVRLFDLLGHGRAMDLISTARKISAAEGLQLGLINRVAPQAGSLDTALALAAMIASNGPVALREVKSVALAIGQRQANFDRETEAAVRCILSDDAVEGIMAFLTKRPTNFNGPPDA